MLEPRDRSLAPPGALHRRVFGKERLRANDLWGGGLLAGNLKGTVACHKVGLARRRLGLGPIAPRIMVKLHC
jgi:hypothetical protein